MAEGKAGDAPLGTTVAEQLQAKERLQAEAAAERGAAQQTEATVERHKEAERQEVARHLASAGAASPEGWRARRRRARERGRETARALDRAGLTLPLVGAVLAGVALAVRRPAWLLLALPLVAGGLLAAPAPHGRSTGA